MKNKLSIQIEKLSTLGSTGDSQDSPKPGGRRDSPAPRIVVCPPMEDSRLTPPTAATGAKLLRAIGRRISRRRADDDAYSSSSSSGSDTGCSEASNGGSSGNGGGSRADQDRTSFSASEASSEGSEKPRHRSTVSLRRVFQSLSISPRSHSSSDERPRQPKKNPQPKRILRSPVTYTYVRGLSGLPTQRVPRTRPSGLNR